MYAFFFFFFFCERKKNLHFNRGMPAWAEIEHSNSSLLSSTTLSRVSCEVLRLSGGSNHVPFVMSFEQTPGAMQFIWSSLHVKPVQFGDGDTHLKLYSYSRGAFSRSGTPSTTYRVHPKLHNIKLHNVTRFLISWNPREPIFVVQISLLIVTFIPLVSRIPIGNPIRNL